MPEPAAEATATSGIVDVESSPEKIKKDCLIM